MNGAPRHRPLVVLTISGILGFSTGMFQFPTWQVAVETAQVVAGLVQYPADNPFYVYHTKLWTVLHQILALLLKAGLSEIALSKLVSGLLGMVSFQALSMLAYALGRDVVLAIGTPFLILFTRAFNHGAVYPIALMGTDHTYGVLGLSTAILVLALLGSGCYRLGGFLLGLAPAVHPSWSAWLALIVSVAFLWDFRKLSAEFRPGLKYFAAGCGVTLLSLLVQLTVTYEAPAIDPVESARYLTGFINAWGGHRWPAAFVSVGMILNVAVLVVTLTWLMAFSGGLPRRAVFVLRALAVSSAISLPLMLVSWLPPEQVPSSLLVLIPSRFLNFNVLLFVSLMIGLLGIYRERLASHAVTAMFAAALFLSYSSLLWGHYPGDGWLAQQVQLVPWHIFVACAAGAIGVALWSAWRSTTPANSSTPWPVMIARGVTVVVLAASAALTWRMPPPDVFQDRTTDPFFAAISAEKKGLIATGGSFHLVQLYTRRPVLLDAGALDALPYSLEAGPQMERILRDVYGIDFFNPPPGARGAGAVPHQVNRPIWEGFSREKWEEIGRAYDVTQVLTRKEWSLDLPIAAENHWFRLYRIPD